jgi:hypothetical protein
MLDAAILDSYSLDDKAIAWSRTSGTTIPLFTGSARSSQTYNAEIFRGYFGRSRNGVLSAILAASL